MVICCIGEFLHHPAELFFCFECIQVGALILQCIKVALHWGVVIRISGPAHAPDHMGGLTEFRKGPGGVLIPPGHCAGSSFLWSSLGFQRFAQRTDRKVTGDMAVRYARYHTPVIKVHDSTVISYFPTFQKQIGEICTSFLVWSGCTKILCQQIGKHFMRFSCLILRLFGAHDRTQAELYVHIFMDRCRAVVDAATFQVNTHSPVTGNTIIFMVDLLNLSQNSLLFGAIFRLPVFPVVIINVWIQAQPQQQPAYTEFLMMLVDKPIRL